MENNRKLGKKKFVLYDIEACHNEEESESQIKAIEAGLLVQKIEVIEKFCFFLFFEK